MRHKEAINREDKTVKTIPLTLDQAALFAWQWLGSRDSRVTGSRNRLPVISMASRE
jgi:hypothetical protein